MTVEGIDNAFFETVSKFITDMSEVIDGMENWTQMMQGENIKSILLSKWSEVMLPHFVDCANKNPKVFDKLGNDPLFSLLKIGEKYRTIDALEENREYYLETMWYYINTLNFTAKLNQIITTFNLHDVLTPLSENVAGVMGSEELFSGGKLSLNAIFNILGATSGLLSHDTEMISEIEGIAILRSLIIVFKYNNKYHIDAPNETPEQKKFRNNMLEFVKGLEKMLIDNEPSIKYLEDNVDMIEKKIKSGGEYVVGGDDEYSSDDSEYSSEDEYSDDDDD